jgi:hypothetical protein
VVGVEVVVLARNVADAVTPPPQGSTRRGRHAVLSSEQIGRFVDFVADSPYLPAWLFLRDRHARRPPRLVADLS